jgi:putative membrane protein
MKKLLFAAMALGTLTFVSCNETTKETETTEIAKDANEEKFDDTKLEDDTEFAVEAANGGMMDVQLGQLALKNGSSAAVREFGGMMVKDHGAANEELKSIAQAKNITLPASMNEDATKMYNDLAAKKGADFDKAYINMMVDDHDKAINKFEEEANDGKSPELKAFAAKILPALKGHKEKLDAIKKSM